jgi:methionyl-tRNA formyltransferase
MSRLLIAATRPWNVRLYKAWAANADNDHETRLIQTRAELTSDEVAAFAPDYVFFPHWSWRIPTVIHRRYECVAFHMTDLPEGRGGSPLQNLLVRGIHETTLSAFRVVEELDGGPVYLKRPLSLHGSAQEIYMRASRLAFAMIDEIVTKRILPVPQEGEPTMTFSRRSPAESLVPEGLDLGKLHDFIRMLDADDYPGAFLEARGFRFQFSRSSLRDDYILADVRITRLAEAQS